MDSELTHARLHPSYCTAPGLFRSLHKGQRKMEKLDVTYCWGSYKIHFVGKERLGADDMRLLQVIVALAGPIGETLSPKPTMDIPIALRRNLEVEAGEVMDALMLFCSASKLLAETGMTDGGGNFYILKASLDRMSSVTVIVTRDGAIVSYKMLSHKFERGTKQLHIALNPMLADAVLDKSSYTRIELDEVRKLKSDAARLIHQRLCGFVNQGQTKKVGFDRLCSYAWGDEPASPATERKRRQRIPSAMRSLSDCGWIVSKDGRKQFLISRPSGSYPVKCKSRPLPKFRSHFPK